MEDNEFRGRLMTLRIIWAALIMGVVMFGVVVVVIGPGREPGDSSFMRMLLYIAIALAATSIPAGFVIRTILWNNGRGADGAVAAGHYSTGNIIFWAMCEGAAFFSLVGALLNAGRGAHLIVAAVCVAVMLASFPTGNPMRGL